MQRNSLVLYSTTSKQLVSPYQQNQDDPFETAGAGICPLCRRELDADAPAAGPVYDSFPVLSSDRIRQPLLRDSAYFENLSQSYNVTPNASRPGTPTLHQQRDQGPLHAASFLENYYASFFKEIKKLGRGHSGSVYLVQHHIENQTLGAYAVKKIPG